jgi:predicted enzyme related to lactoylglutathione lyase
MDYWMVNTGDGVQGINSGLLQRRGPQPSEGQAVNAHVYTVEVPSVDEYWNRAIAAGGAGALPKMAIPGVGFVAYVKDPDGSIFGLFQPVQS